MSQLEVDKVLPQSGTTLTLGESGDTITIPSGATFSATLTAPVIDEINDNNGNEEIIFTTTASAVNELTIANAATGNAPEISATGGDTNIDLKLTPKGTGKLNLDGIKFPNADGSAGQFLQTNGSGVLSFASAGATAGQVIQVVQTAKTDTFTTTSTSFVDVTGLSVSITPSSASNKILVLVQISYGGAVNMYGSAKLIRGSTSIFEGDSDSANRTESTIPMTTTNEANSEASKMYNGSIFYLDSPSTTSSTTYKIQIRTNSAGENITVNRTGVDIDASFTNRSTSSITVMEVKG
jgi:hypothetical protein